jgi:type II secretion system protein G
MRARAFTYIELMVVVSMIAILAAIGVPNFLEAQTRSKIARARADMSVLLAALEDYRLDWRDYPPNLPWMQAMLASPEGVATPAPASPEGLPPLAPAPAGVFNDAFSFQTPLYRLTTPVQYIGEIPSDPFFQSRAWGGRGPLLYADWSDLPEIERLIEPNAGAAPIALLSAGPDCELDTAYPSPANFVPYDATNGTVSGGDLHDVPR